MGHDLPALNPRSLPRFAGRRFVRTKRGRASLFHLEIDRHAGPKLERYVTCEQFPVGIDCKRLAIGGCQIVDGVIRSSKRSRRVLDRQKVIGGIITVARPAAIYGRSRPGGFLPRINQRKVLEGEIAYVAGYERKVVDQRRGGQKAINRWKGTAGLGHKTSPAVGSLGIYGQDTPGKENRQFRFQPVDKPVATLSLFDDLNPLAQFA